MNESHFFPARRVLAGAALLLLLTLLPTTTTSAAGPPGSVYIVQYGDTMSSIAARFGVSLQALMQANGYAYAPRMLYVGRQMHVPYNSTYSPYSTSRGYGYSMAPYGMSGAYGYSMSPYGGPAYAPSYGSNSSRFQLYIVRFGDTLTRIALRFRTSIRSLMIANNIANPNLIFAGMRLVIPRGAGYAPNGAPSYGSSPYGSSPYGSAPYSSGSGSSPYGSAPSPMNPPTANPGATGSAVSLMNTAYNPRNLTVRVGTQVTWTNNETSQVPHTVTSGTPNAPSGTFDSGTLNPGQNFQFTFSTPGTYAYYCRIHGAAMTGTITVTQ